MSAALHESTYIYLQLTYTDHIAALSFHKQLLLVCPSNQLPSPSVQLTDVTLMLNLELEISGKLTNDWAATYWCSIWKLRCPVNQSLNSDFSTLHVADSCISSHVTWRSCSIVIGRWFDWLTHTNQWLSRHLPKTPHTCNVIMGSSSNPTLLEHIDQHNQTCTSTWCSSKTYTIHYYLDYNNQYMGWYDSVSFNSIQMKVLLIPCWYKRRQRHVFLISYTAGCTEWV